VEFIFTNIQNRIKKYSQQKFHNDSTIQHTLDKSQKTYFTVPFINHISSLFKSISLKLGCPMAFTIPNTLKIFIKTGKDKIESSNRSGVVYRIDCRDCEASYVGQTKRRLITRI